MSQVDRKYLPDFFSETRSISWSSTRMDPEYTVTSIKGPVIYPAEGVRQHSPEA